MRTNQAKQKLLRGEPAIGAAAALSSPWSAGALSRAGYDWVLMDAQHGFWPADQIRTGVLTILQGDAAPVARVTHNDYSAIGRLLDDGLMGIIVPIVNTRDDAEAAARAIRYPPAGERSMAGTFITGLYGSDYAESANSEVVLAVQIESAQAVENAEDILSVEGVDGCWVGPADLALSMGLDLAEAGVNKKHNEAVAHVLEMCKKTGKFPGYACGSMEMGRRRIAEGFTFVSIGADATFVAEGAESYLKDLRA